MKHSVNFEEGVEICKYNSDRLATSGRVIINHEDGTESYGLFLLYIAYEELAKSIFCLFVSRGWTTYDFVKDVFSNHEPKLFVFDEILASFELIGGTAYLGGKKIGEIKLEDFIAKHKDTISSHRELTKKFLYIEPMGNNWHVPFTSIKNLKQKQKMIEDKISYLHSILHVLQTETVNSLNNFKIFKDDEGRHVLQWDAF